jgi:hypothetical protein
MKRATSAILAASAVVALAACAGQTNPATSVTHDAATLHASLRCDRGERGDYWGEYRRVGTSPWTQVGRQTFDCGAGADSREESFRVGRLQPSTSYEFRVCGDLTNPNHPVLCADSAGTAHRPGDTTGRAYDRFTTQAAPPPPNTDVPLPARAAFYYPWFPETWTVNGAHVFYHPDLGYYSSDVQAVADAHIRALDYGKVKVPIASWWGQNQHAEHTRIPLLMDRTAALGSSIKWTLYYEKEGRSNPTAAQLRADLSYISSRYANRPEFARVLGKPVIFVYNANDTTCEVADRWHQAAASNWYVVLKVFPGFATCANRPSAWHQYGPASPVHSHDRSYVISPGFWRADEASPRLARDPARFAQNVRDMVASGKSWQIVTSFNEWGEGTSVEGAQEWASPSGFGTYLDILHK